MPLALRPAEDDLASRRIAWGALSDLFLDTDTSISRPWRAKTLAESPYSIEELEFILIREVYPICKYNLLSIAGEWAGFDPTWLERSILRRLRSPFRYFHSFNLGRFTVPISSEWRATKTSIRNARAKQNAT